MISMQTKLVTIIPGVDKPGSYDEDHVFPILTEWLKRHHRTDANPPLFVSEDGLTFHRIFFLGGEEVVAAFTVSRYYDPTSVTMLSGIVVDANWGDFIHIGPFLEAMTAFAHQMEYGFLTVPTKSHIHHRQFIDRGYELHATGDPVAEDPVTTYYRVNLVTPNVTTKNILMNLVYHR